MALNVHGQRDLKFEFWRRDARDEVIARIKSLCAALSEVYNPDAIAQPLPTPVAHKSTTVPQHAADILALPRDLLFQARTFSDEALSYMPFIANKPLSSTAHLTPRHFICLTIGSRGDVQPYIALGLRLKQDGHRVTIVTHGVSRKHDQADQSRRV